MAEFCVYVLRHVAVHTLCVYQQPWQKGPMFMQQHIQYKRARQTMPAPDCLQWPPYGQWLTNSISLLSHFPVLLLICHPQACQIKVWQKWRRTLLKTRCSVRLRKSTRIELHPKTNILRSIALYRFHLLVLGDSRHQQTRTMKNKKYETWGEWGWEVGESRVKKRVAKTG